MLCRIVAIAFATISLGCGNARPSTVMDSSSPAASQYENFSTIIALSQEYLSLSTNENYIEPVHEEGWRNGAYTWSDGNRNVRVELDLVADENKLAIDTLVFTTTELTSRSTSNQQGVNASWWSQATINTGSRAGLRLLEDNGNVFSMARTNANTTLRITGLNIQARGLFAGAKKRKAREKIMAGVPGARHRLSSDAIRVADANLNTKVRKAVDMEAMITLKKMIQTQKLANNGASRLRLRSTGDELQIGLQSNTPTLKTPTLNKSDQLIRVHTSDINEILSAKFSAKTLNSNDISAIFEEVLGKKPTNSAAYPTEELGLVTFAAKAPVTLTAKDNRLTITLRATKFDTGRVYKLPMNITLQYNVKNTDGFSLERDKTPEVLPPEYNPENPRLSRRQKILILELTEVFNESFDPVLIKSSEELNAKTGNRIIFTSQLSADNGWLLINKTIAK